MSRIEKAIEKANKMRQQTGNKPTVAVAPRAETPVRRSSSDEIPQVPALKPDNPSLIINRDPTEGAAEEYRKLKSVILEMTQQGTFENTLLVTSDLPAAGKTLTSLNLALTLAREYDHTVLLVDADLRKPSVHRYLGISPEKGLLQCLTEDYPLEKALVRTGIGKLVVLPAGGVAEDPAELLASHRMRELVAELKSRYADRYVIFDTTPLLPFAEASLLASLVDGVLMVVRERQTRTSHLEEALELLKAHKLLGIVYNDADMSQKMSHYKYYGY